MINDQYKKMKNLFLRQSYIDAWEDYQRSIRKKSFAQWDYIVLTASNEEQANAFRSQITYIDAHRRIIRNFTYGAGNFAIKPMKSIYRLLHALSFIAVSLTKF